MSGPNEAPKGENLAPSEKHPGESLQTVPASPGNSSCPEKNEAMLACVEGMSWDELQATADPTSYCTSCGSVCTETVLVAKKIRKKGHQRLRCVNCQRITTMLYKRVDMQALGFKDLDPEQARHVFVAL